MAYEPVPKQRFRIPSGLKQKAKELAASAKFKEAFAQRWHPKWFEELVREHQGEHGLVIHAGVRHLVNKGETYSALTKEHAALYVAMQRLAKTQGMKAKAIWHAHGGT